MKKLFILLALVFALATPGLAQTLYVTDKLEVPLRAGTSTRYKIVRMLESGDQVQVLKHDKESGHSQVKTADGTTGWILTRYLMNEPMPRERMIRAEKALEPLKAENAQLKEQLQALSGTQQEANARFSKLQEENQRLSQELAQIHKTAANAIAIDRRNRELEKQMVDLERELQLVEQENQSMSDGNAQAWFLRGAGVLLLGGILGLIIPRVSWQKRNRWGEL